MSSADEDVAPLSKKRKLQRACDYCRRKKIRCDGPQMPSNRCSKCISRRLQCTYVESSNRISYSSSYVEKLENRLDRMEKLLEKLCPDGDVSKELEGHQSERDPPAETPVSERSQPSSSRRAPSRPLSPPSLAVTPQTPGDSDDFNPSDDDVEDANKRLSDDFGKLSLGVPSARYHGKSSGWLIIRNALELKEQLVPDQPKEERSERRHPWLKRTETEELPIFGDFPPQDLMNMLVDLYFRNINDHFPLLHEPIFKKAIVDGLHLRHGGFGATVLLVCANGSRFTRDPSVLLDGTDQEQSVGWKWFQQVEDARKPPLAPARLHDLQIYVLMILFLQGSSVPQATWTLMGIGIRAAVDVGAHRRRMYSTPPTPEDELWKRAFWILVVMEWTMSFGLGRPASIHDEDIDVSLPTEVDDEYWTSPDGQVLFKQPPDKPSKISSFTYYVRLAQILAFASRTLYSINKSRVQLVHGDQEWEQRIVAELDSALNKWLASLPDHLRWDPTQKDDLFLTQAASLSSTYYQFQVAVHRPFISSSHRDSSLSFPSLIICMNAARASIRVLDTLCQRTGTPRHINMGTLFMSGIVLMMNVLGERRAGRTVNVDRDLACVQKCVDMLKLTRHEMHVSDTLSDILRDLLTAANTSSASKSSSSVQNKGAPREEPATSASTTFVPQNITRHTGDITAGGASQAYAGYQPGASSATVNFAQRDIMSQPPISQPGAQEMHGLPFPFTIHSDELSPMSYDHLAQQHPLSSFAPSSFQQSTGTSLQGFLGNNAPVQSTNTDSGLDLGLGNGGGGDVAWSTFGLEPLGYSEAIPQHPSTGVPDPQSQPDGWMDSAPRAGSADANASTDAANEMLDFAFLDDTLTVWSNAPTSFGLDDWGAYLNNVHDAGNTGG